MATVQEILDLNIPSPTWAWRPTIAAPIRSDMTFTRPDQGDPDPTSRTLDPRTTIFQGRGADVERIYGGGQGLLMEGSSTNHTRNSSDFSILSGSSAATPQGTPDSILEGGTARRFDAGGSQYNRFVKICNAGSDITTRQIFTWIYEHIDGSSLGAGGRVYDRSNNNTIVEWSYDSSNAEDNRITIHSTGASNDYKFSKYHIVTENGPNGGTVVRVDVLIEASSSYNREIWGFPDRVDGNDSVIAHYFGVDDKGISTSPIETGSSSVTRGRDQVDIFRSGNVPQWWNKNQGTLVFDFDLLTIRSNLITFLNFQADEINITGEGETLDWVLTQKGDFREYLDNSLYAYERNRAAVSILPNEYRLAANGQSLSRTNGVSGRPLDTSDLYIQGPPSSVIYGVRYLPKALTRPQLEIVTK